MPSPPVVVEMSASDATTAYAQVLVEACNEGLRGEGRCVLEGAVPTDGARAVAIVSWEGTGRAAAKIEVGVRRAAHADWLTRRVTFDPSDAELERFRSIGLIIATLLGNDGALVPAGEEPTSPPVSPIPTKPAPPEASRATSARNGSWFLEADAEAARGAGNGFAAWGATARAGAPLAPTTLFVTGSLRYEIDPNAAPQVRLEWGWITVGLGVAIPLGAAPLVVEARCEPTLGGIRATVAGGGSSSGALFGVREGIGITWWWGRWIGPVLSAEALETTRSAVVNVSSGAGYVPETKSQWLGWSTALGLRFRTN